MHSSLLATQTGHSHLRRLFMLRNWAILAQLATLLLVYRFLSTELAWLPMLSTVGVLALANGQAAVGGVALAAATIDLLLSGWMYLPTGDAVVARGTRFPGAPQGRQHLRESHVREDPRAALPPLDLPVERRTDLP